MRGFWLLALSLAFVFGGPGDAKAVGTCESPMAATDCESMFTCDSLGECLDCTKKQRENCNAFCDGRPAPELIMCRGMCLDQMISHVDACIFTWNLQAWTTNGWNPFEFCSSQTSDLTTCHACAVEVDAEFPGLCEEVVPEENAPDSCAPAQGANLQYAVCDFVYGGGQYAAPYTPFP